MTRIAPLVAIVLTCACSDQGGQAPGGPDEQGDALATALIGPDGGTLSLDDGSVVLQVPAGALAEETELTISASTAETEGMLGAAYHFGPDGLAFAVDATLTFGFDGDDLPDGSMPYDVLLARRPGGESVFATLASDVATDSIGGDGAVSAQIGGFSTYAAVSLAGVRCNGVFGLGDRQIWAFCAGGQIYQFDGAISPPQVIAPGVELLDGWGRTANDMYSVGHARGRAYFGHSDGSGWSDAADQPSAVMVAVDGNPTCAVAVGANGGAFEGDLSGQAAWSGAQTGAPSHLWAVKVFDDCSAVAVGQGGFAARQAGTWVGSDLSGLGAGRTITLRSVWGTSLNDVWAAGYETTGSTWTPLVVRWDGAQWAEEGLPAGLDDRRLLGIWGMGSQVFAVGDGGLLLHHDGQAWSVEVSATTADLFDVWSAVPETVAAVGVNDTFVYLCPDDSTLRFCLANTVQPPGPDAGTDGGDAGTDQGQDGGTNGVTVTVDTYDPNNQPVDATWVAFQEGAGQWSPVAPQSTGSYQFDLASSTGAYSVIVVCDSGQSARQNGLRIPNARTRLFSVTAAEVTAFAIDCQLASNANPVYRLEGDLINTANVGTSEAELQMGLDHLWIWGSPYFWATVFPATYDIAGVEIGERRLNFARITSLVLERDVAITADMTQDVDFGNAVAVTYRDTTGANPTALDPLCDDRTTALYTTTNGTLVSLSTDIAEGGEYAVVPEVLRQPGEKYTFLYSVFQSDDCAADGRMQVHSVSPLDTLTPPIDFNAAPELIATTTVPNADPYAQFESVFAPLDATAMPVVGYHLDYFGGNKRERQTWWHVYISQGVIGSASSFTYRVPDLSGVSGWDEDWPIETWAHSGGMSIGAEAIFSDTHGIEAALIGLLWPAGASDGLTIQHTNQDGRNIIDAFGPPEE